jgi:hypothetical protein
VSSVWWGGGRLLAVLLLSARCELPGEVEETPQQESLLGEKKWHDELMKPRPGGAVVACGDAAARVISRASEPQLSHLSSLGTNLQYVCVPLSFFSRHTRHDTTHDTTRHDTRHTQHDTRCSGALEVPSGPVPGFSGRRDVRDEQRASGGPPHWLWPRYLPTAPPNPRTSLGQ